MDPSTRATRIFGARALLNEATTNADAVTVSNLQGRLLLLHTADGDASLTLQDSAGRALWSLNAQQTATAMIYEAGSLGGRPQSLTEMASGAPAVRVRERYHHAPAGSAQWKARNLCGTLQETCNNAGIDRLLGLSLTGKPLASEQCLLKVEIEQPDWSRTTEEDVEAPLEVLNQLDATGALLSTTHAAGVTTSEVYDISGARGQTRVSYRNSGKVEEVAILRDARYDANERLLQQTAGNGLVDRYEYDSRSLRLKRHLTARPEGHDLGSLVISDSHYDHDPAGNILSLDDQGADPEWHNNLEATGLRQYTYDTLNRLVLATGRERVAAARHHPSSGTQVDPSAGSVWAPYTEEYSYDDGDNLYLIRHNGGTGGRTRALDVAQSSNRATVKSAGMTLDEAFLAGGLQKRLADGRALHWHADNQLRAVSLVSREQAEDDSERYHYLDGGKRTRKMHSVVVGRGRQITLTTYTRAFEVRQRLMAGATELQRHVVITTVGTARLVMNELNGDTQLRFSFSDHLNSSGGEADAAGKVIAREEYAPYGGTVGVDEPAIEIDNMTQRTMRHAGKERDETGLYYYGWRYYQPETGRWLSADPGGTRDGINLFQMAKGSPVRFLDADGQESVDPAKLIKQTLPGYPATPDTIARLSGRTPNDDVMDAEIEHTVLLKKYTVHSGYQEGVRLLGFVNEFRPHVWILRHNFSDPEQKTYASTVVLEQYRLISKANGFYGQLPRTILRWDVVNDDAISAARITPEELLKSPEQRRRVITERFLDSPGNGRHTQRIVNALGMDVTSVKLHSVKTRGEKISVIAINVRPQGAHSEEASAVDIALERARARASPELQALAFEEIPCNALFLQRPFASVAYAGAESTENVKQTI
ncbi:RHS repeat-associated core domain-containing protein [Pseudomonas sp. CC120222-01a]|uniref:RHS repeat-associated core domain-containing protein n=1 Tax=Pseudomonas sp. CC120222-01a TaxID=1378075 RepID=UPI0013053594|nr:RHS repeat-associated core domain-containing protein [Pseudomonas sp. CC120222-01a]